MGKLSVNVGDKDKTIEQLRAEYKKIRARSEAKSPAEFDAAVMKRLTIPGCKPTATDFVDAAKLVSFRCGRCAGTGQFITMVVNGQPKGPGGICFRCEGKGLQNDADVRRNYGADLHQKVYLG